MKIPKWTVRLWFEAAHPGPLAGRSDLGQLALTEPERGVGEHVAEHGSLDRDERIDREQGCLSSRNPPRFARADVVATEPSCAPIRRVKLISAIRMLQSEHPARIFGGQLAADIERRQFIGGQVHLRSCDIID